MARMVRFVQGRVKQCCTKIRVLGVNGKREARILSRGWSGWF